MGFEDFYRSLLPGNYALTKSMELTRKRTCGTLWYMKKFLVLYYYVFLSRDIMTREYIEKAVNAFDNYIAGLDEAVRPDAERYFYPENGIVNLKSPQFKSFTAFAGHWEFENEADMKNHYQSAKKLYFNLLMGSGGQSGVKKLLKEEIERPGFVYSKASMERAIMDAVSSVCAEQANLNHEITDRSVKYIISQAAMEDICAAAVRRPLTPGRALEIIAGHDDNGYRFQSIENDAVGFIRNERQILYYYGYFHSKTAGAKDFEFSSLTPVGELALEANAREFLAIWEHQKLKMLSQPPVADIKDVNISPELAEGFAVSFSPYTDVLGHLARNGEISTDQYKYAVSRRKHTISGDEWLGMEQEVLNRLPELKSRVEGFGRRGDITNEDGHKELSKYLLGVRCDLPRDGGACPLGAVTQGRTWRVTDGEKLEFIYGLYSLMQSYKEEKYSGLFLRCENDLRGRYRAAAAGESISPDPGVKISWDLYNIRTDKFILLGAIAAITMSELRLYDFRDNAQDAAETVIAAAGRSFSGLMRRAGLSRRDLRQAVFAFCSGDYSSFAARETEEREPVLAAYRRETAEDLMTKIRDVSARAASAVTEGRRRSGQLVSLLKSYYMERYMEGGFLKCECCGETTFITAAGEPYVEFHHLIPFKLAGGPDHYLNLFALCPNCHRKIHFLGAEAKEPEYRKINDGNYLSMTFLERLTELKSQYVLKSYHLEYLLAEKAVTEAEYDAVAS